MVVDARGALALALEALRWLPTRCMCGAHPPAYRCVRCRAIAACERELASETVAPAYSSPISTEAEWRDRAAP